MRPRSGPSPTSTPIWSAGLSADGTQVISSTAYDPFGQETATNGTTPALGYQSGWTDPTSGDVNMAARWYQPGTGGFTSRDTWQLDPSQSAQRANRYSYGFGSPQNGTDPTGHFFPLVALGGLAVWEALGWGTMRRNRRRRRSSGRRPVRAFA